MVEILGNNLKKFFDIIDNPPKDAEITYAGNRYEVWEVSDELHNKMCDMSEEEFIELAGEDAEKFQKMLDALDDLDDVQDVYHSADMPEEEE